MAKCVNKALLLGYAGKAPEIRSTAGGTLAASFSLATSERQQDRQGNWIDKTEWHNVVAYGRTAEIVRDYLNKGTQVFIQGKIQTRSWDDKESGQKRNRTEIVALEVTLISRGRGENGNSGWMNASERGDQVQPENAYESGDLRPEDIPF